MTVGQEMEMWNVKGVSVIRHISMSVGPWARDKLDLVHLFGCLRKLRPMPCTAYKATY